jgi:hypothetical protein
MDRTSIRSNDEDGIAMIVVMVLAAVMLALALSVVALGLHANDASTRDRKWNAAHAVAEGATEDLFVQWGKTVFEAAGTQDKTSLFNDSFAGGAYEQGSVKFCTAAGVNGCPLRGYIRVEAVGAVPNRTSRQAVRRRIVSFYGPDPTFKYALFSFGSLNLQNQSSTGTTCEKVTGPDIEGDVFANGDIYIGNGQEIEGSALSATGSIALGSNACLKLNDDDVGGTAYSGGYSTSGSSPFAVTIGNGAIIEGDAEGRAPCPTTGQVANFNQYRINLETSSSWIKGKAFSPAVSASGSGTITGGFTQTCKQQLQPVQLPTLPSSSQAMTDFDLRNCPTTHNCTFTHNSVAIFQTWLTTNASAVRGFHKVIGSSSDLIDLTGTTIRGEFVLRAEGATTGAGTAEGPKIKVGSASNKFYIGDGSNTDGSEILVQIITNNEAGGGTCSGGQRALELENGLDFTVPFPPDRPASLFYAKGCAKVGNNITVPGALWAQGIDASNSMKVEYNSAVEQAPGVGANRLTRVRTIELAP